jgi:hypothetical protein
MYCIASSYSLNSEPVKLLSGEILQKNRSFAYLLLPLLVLIFMIGWILYFVGQSKSNTKKIPPRIMHSVNQSATENDLEIGILTEKPQEQAIKG